MAENINTNITRQAPFIEDYIGSLLGSTKSLIDKPYTQYSGNRVAGFAGDQLDAFNLARQGIGAYAPYLAQAGDYANYGMQQWQGLATPAAQYAQSGTGAVNVSPYTNAATSYGAQSTGYNVNPYLNPYTQNVVDTTMTEMNRQQEMDQDRLDAQAVQAGAFGGSRHGVAEAEMQRGFDQNRTQAIANLYNTGYQNAQQAQESHMQRLANASQLANQTGQLYGTTMADNYSRQLQASQQLGALGEAGGQLNLDTSRIMSGLGGLAQQYNQGDATMLAQIGGMQQGQQQAIMDINYNNFLEQQMQPYQRLGYFSDILRGVPTSQSTLTSTTTPQKSQLAQGLGALGQFASTGQTFGWWGDSSSSSSGSGT